jgi:outer membrane protein TolC
MPRRLSIALIGAALQAIAGTPVLHAQAPAVPPPVVAPQPAPPQPAQPLPARPPIMAPAPVAVRLSFDDAVRQAVERNPDVARAAQSILRAEAFLMSARSVFQPVVNGAVTTTILNEARGFEGTITQPQTQTAFGVQAAYPILAASRWAQATQAADQVGIAKIGSEETRRQVSIAVSDAYLAVIALHRQVEVSTQAIENGRAHLDFATTRLQAGAGSRLNEIRAAQEVSSDEVLLAAAILALRRAQEALGVLVVADGPVDTAGEPAFEIPGEQPEGWLSRRTDIRFADAEVAAAERVRKDSWKDWVPTGVASIQPQFLAPTADFQDSSNWTALIQFGIPIWDGGQRRSAAKQRDVDLELTRIDRVDLERVIRSDERLAREAVRITAEGMESARRAASQAAEVVRITDVAFRAGATTNLEVVDAQRRARDADIAAAVAEDRVRQARLDLLVALGLFPR